MIDEEKIQQFTIAVNLILAVINQSNLLNSEKIAALIESIRIAHVSFGGKDIDINDFHHKMNSCLIDNFPPNSNGEDPCTNSTETIQ